MAPLVSIVIPTCNRKAMVIDALDSCFGQVWANIEVIVVDDGSTDATESVMERYRANHGQRFIYHRQARLGAPAARNRGLALSQGDYIQFLDSDDILFSDKIAAQVGILEACGQDVVACSCYGQMGSRQSYRRIGRNCLTIPEYIASMCANEVHVMQTSAPLWRRPFLMSRAGWREDLPFGQDLEYHVRLLVDARHLQFVERELFLVRVHSGDRISDIASDIVRIRAAFKTRESLQTMLEKAGKWTVQTQQGSLRAARQIYFNILETGTHQDIKSFEQWLWRLSQTPRRGVALPLLIILRTVVGRVVMLAVLRTFISAKRLTSRIAGVHCS